MKYTILPIALASALATASPGQAQSVGLSLNVTGDSSGDNGPITEYLGGDNAPAGYREFQITVTNAAEFAVTLTRVITSFVGAGDAGGIAVLWLSTADGPELSTLNFTEFSGHPETLGITAGLAGGTFFQGLVEDGGEYRLMVGSQYCLSCVMTYDIDFDLFGAILGWAPSIVEQLEETGALMVQTGLGTMLITRTNTRDAVNASFASRDATNAMATDEGLSQMMGATHVWMRASGFQSTGNGRSFTSPMLQVGADVEVGQNLLAGLALGRANLSASATDFSFSGTQVTVQPYLGWRKDGWHGTAGLSLGKTDYDTITHLGGSATATGKLRAGFVEVGKDIALEGGQVLSPMASLTKGRIELATTSGTLAGSGVGDVVDFTRFGLGAELRKSLGDGEVTFGLMAEHTDTDAAVALTSGAFDQTGWAGRASIGFLADLNNGLSIDAGVSLGGLGQSNREASAHFEIAKRF